MQVLLQTFPFSAGGAAMLLAALACGLSPEVQAQMPPPPAMRALPGSPSGAPTGSAPGSAPGALATTPLRMASAPSGDVPRDLSTTQQMQLQQDLERRNKAQNTLSNVVKKSAATGTATTANVK